MRVNITPDHISRGCASLPCDCPVALAINDAINPRYKARVGVTGFELLGTDGISFVSELPIDAVRFIENFDAGVSVIPITLELEIPSQFQCS
jgi:hypothetical protein